MAVIVLLMAVIYYYGNCCYCFALLYMNQFWLRQAFWLRLAFRKFLLFSASFVTNLFYTLLENIVADIYSCLVKRFLLKIYYS